MKIENLNLNVKFRSILRFSGLEFLAIMSIFKCCLESPPERTNLLANNSLNAEAPPASDSKYLTYSTAKKTNTVTATLVEKVEKRVETPQKQIMDNQPPVPEKQEENLTRIYSPILQTESANNKIKFTPPGLVAETPIRFRYEVTVWSFKIPKTAPRRIYVNSLRGSGVD